ncbi:MAG: nitrophenyl compound nitroreductase subunit ArsF family protein [Candidatus Omnitrophica bacterium]|nr:nitrophenyl compound nitroreductase subunit ArsF family protein [Candidatus Omnitrophota bacterium]
MKKLFFVFSAIVLLSSGTVFLSLAQAVNNTKGPQVIAYYFHGIARCSTCYKLEQYSREVIEGNFKNELSSGKLVFKVVNVEEKGNEHYVKDYQLYTKALILSLIKNGQENKWMNMDKIWEYVRDKKRFMNYVNSEVADFLGQAQ